MSLDPPLVLWSLAKSAQSRDAFDSSGHFAIHILAESQEALSNRFGRSGGDKFSGLDWSSGVAGSPLLSNYAAVFECRTKYQYEGGDHVILVGEVIEFRTHDEAPLLFHGGRYVERRPRPPAAQAETIDLETGEFTEDFLFYLLARAYFQASRPARRKSAELGLDQQQHAVLVTLSMQGPVSAEAIGRMLEHSDHAPGEQLLDEMARSGLLTKSADTYELAAPGRHKLIQVLAVSQAFESDIADRMTSGELAEARRLLRRIIDLTGPEMPIGWRS